MANEMYPSLSQLLPLDKIPNELEGIKDAIGAIFEELYVKNLIANQSPDGSAGFYSFNLTTNDSIGLNIPIADDLRLVLNPTNVGTTEIPVSFDYSWIILKYINNFNHQSFDNSIASILNILFDLAGLDQKTFLSDIVNTFYIGPTGLNDFVNDFNSSNPGALQIPSDPTFTQHDQIESLVGQISKADLNLMQFTYETNIDVDNEGLERLKKLFRRYFDNIEESLKEAIKLNFNVSINKVSVGLQFPQKWLIPVDAQNEPLPDTFFSYLTFDVGSLFYSSEGGFKFNNISAFNLTKSMIGNTGLIAEFSGLKVDLNKDGNIPEAIADGRPDNFLGVYAENATITLPKKWFNTVDGQGTTLKLAGYNVLIGTGGLSGRIALEAVTTGNPVGAADFLWKQIGSGATGFKVGFNRFDMTFKQNSVVESSIQGLLEINRFKFPSNHPTNPNQPFRLGIIGHIGQDGDFNLTAVVQNGIKASLGKFVDFNFLTLELGRENDTFYVGTSVELSFPNGLMSTLTEGKKIVLPKVRIYSDGSFEIVGGNGFLPVNFSLPLGPVDLAVTGIHIGSIQRNYNGEQRKYNYIGFDGAISVNPFGIDARGEGIKYYYTVDDDSFGGIGDAYLHIQTIYIDMVVPYNAPEVAIKGMLSIPEPGVSQEYQGSVSFQSKKTNVSGNASMRLIPKYPAFLVDASVDLPKPIPLGSVSIYGFRGLIGHRYVAEKKAVKTVTLTESSSWYDYYKAPQKGINIAKFSSPEQTSGYSNPFSFGLGVVIGTSFDNGNVLSVRAMMLLSLPSLYMIEGRASILSSKTGLADSSEPPFFANLTYSSTSIEMGIGADYKLPRNNGQILELYAEAQAAFFQNNPSNWYVNIGTKEKPNQATLFKDLINLKPMSYLMLSAKGVEAGARIDYELKKSFFGIKVHLYAYVEVGAKISFERPQLGGYLSLGGGIDVNVWRMIRINFELNAILSAEAVEPYLLFAELKFRGSIKLGFFRIRFKVKLKLKWEENSTINKNAIPPLPYLDTTNANGTFPKRVLELVKGTHMLTNESFPIDYLGVDLNTIDVRKIKTYIPLDTYIDIKTVKGLDPSLVSPKIGGHTSGATEYLDLIPPEKTVKGGVALRQVKHRYSIERIEIKALVGTEWVDYHPYEAVVEAADRDLVKNFKIGYWQRSGNQYNTIRLLANNPLSYLDAGEPGWIIPEQYGVTPSNLFCHTEINKWHTSNVLNKVLGTIYQLPLQFQAHYINGAYFTLIDEYDMLIPITDSIAVNTMQVTDVANVHNFAQSLSISNYNKLVIVLPQDAVVVKLKLSSKSENVKITCYRTISDSASITVQYEEVASIVKTALALNSELVYPNSFGISAPYLPIMKIIIEPIVPVNDEIIAIQEQIEALFTETYEGLNGISNVLYPNNLTAYLDLNVQLQQLLNYSCFPQSNPCLNYIQTLCDLYSLLSGMDCFGEVTEISQLKDECYRLFTSHLNEFANLYPEYRLLFTAYIDAHKNFVAVRTYVVATDEEVLELYTIMWKEAERLLSLLLILGNCNCSNISTSNCTTSLQQVQWKTVVDFDFETTIPGADAVNEDRLLMQEAIARNPQPVWRPNTTYHIKFSLKDNVDDGSNNSKTFNYYYGFKTSGPVGYYHNTPGVRYGNEYSITNQLLNRKDIYGNIDPNGELTNPDQYTLTSLRSYIDYNRSYPNADGNLILAKPLYYSNKECRISVFFTKSYAYNLMNSWPEYKDMQELKGTLNIMIKDPVSDLLIPYPLPENYDESVPQPNPGSETGTIWESDTSPQLPIGAITLNHYLMNGNIECEIEPGAILAPASFNYSVILTNLKASKLYTAILNNAFDKNNSGTIDSKYSENQEVHRFVFQTSRYGTFQEHVQSYLLTDGFETRKAIFKISSKVSPMEIQTAFEIVSGQNITVGDADNYIDLYDRVIENVFRLKPFEAPLTTEFNLLVNSEDDSIIAIIIRSPEPFNNPRMPKAVINETIKVVGENDEDLSDYPILHSKDCSQAIIMYDGVIGVSSLRIMFDYLAWNGNEFERPADVSKEYVDINL